MYFSINLVSFDRMHPTPDSFVEGGLNLVMLNSIRHSRVSEKSGEWRIGEQSYAITSRGSRLEGGGHMNSGRQ